MRAISRGANPCGWTASPFQTDFLPWRSVAPISEERERPRIRIRGRFLLRVRNWRFGKHPGMDRPRKGISAVRRVSAVPGCWARAAGEYDRAKGLALFQGANAKHRSNGFQRYGFACPSGARGVAVAYARGREKVFREDVGSEVERRFTPITPVRIRHVTTG